MKQNVQFATQLSLFVDFQARHGNTTDRYSDKQVYNWLVRYSIKSMYVRTYMHELTILNEELSCVERTRVITCYSYPFGMCVSLTCTHRRHLCKLTVCALPACIKLPLSCTVLVMYNNDFTTISIIMVFMSRCDNYHDNKSK